MSVKNYRFVSPGVFVNEIDNSQVPASPAGIGPVVIGRAASGPALRPVTVRSFEEFVNIFGSPAPGAAGGDVWREGTNKSSTTYGMYAAQAYLRNSSPMTYIRLLGANHEDADASDGGNAGWTADGGAYGLVVFEEVSATSASASVTCLSGAALVGSGVILSLTGSGGDLELSSSLTDTGPGAVVIGATSLTFATELARVITLSGSTPKLTATASGSVVTIKSTLAGVAGLVCELSSSDAAYFNVTASDSAPEGLSGSFEGGTEASLDGALAAMLYSTAEDTTFSLTGTIADFTTSVPGDGETTASCDAIIRAIGPNKEFKLRMSSSAGTTDTAFNFTTTDSRYIRKVLNTNPQLTNSDTTTTNALTSYFLGETFDRHLSANITSNGADNTFASIVKLAGGLSDKSGNNFKTDLKSARTPWVISSRLSPTDNLINLFYFEALEQPGDWTNRNIKISIQDIKRSTNDSTDYGTFSVVVRHLSDSDNVVRIIEQFNNCDLNPNSLNYVARKIGTQQRVWSSDRHLRLEGDWPNNSSHVRVVVNTDLGASIGPTLLPFGFRGILKYDNELFWTEGKGNWISGSAPFPSSGIMHAGPFWATGSANTTASVYYPAPELRVNASDGGLSNKTDAYFGFQTTTTAGGTQFDRSTIDLLRPRGGIAADMFGSATADSTENSVVFTLDDVSGSGVWVSGSHSASSLTYVNGAIEGVLDAGYDRFTVPMYGGFDGVDIKDMDAFANNSFVPAADPEDCYVLSTFRRAIDTIADPETVEMSMATIPGLTHEGLTTHLINTCEDRADALAIIDLPDAFQPREEGDSVERLNTASNITSLINALRSRGLNSSYGCTYYPWVRARDTINGAFLWLPPSIPALGTLSSSQRKTQVWFAPAGFNRGGLTEGSAGIPVVDVAHQLRRKDRDDLYAANINPIAKFPAEGIVIFGQKTLQVTPSALDRINVRRLMIFVKKRISQIAAGLLFDPNIRQTWLRFTAQVNPFLQDVKTNFGLSAFKVVLDEATTTPDLVDRNIMYAQIFLKPTRAIEFIAIDFNISRTGASFED